jgi:hypothetical protein
MEEIALEDGISLALTSLLGDRLALLAGAGLSMAPPSSLPSAEAIARSAKEEYDAIFGTTRPPLAAQIADQAEFFFQRGELMTVYFRTLIDANAFAGQPNAGHFAAADLLLVRGIQTGVTTNVDALIETAGQLLFGQVGVGIDVATVAALSPDISPLLKIHGCRVVDQANMVWAPSQLHTAPVSARIAESAQWLKVRLLDRDLLIVGYWTDWDYLNSILATTLGAVRPARVIVVDPADGTSFADKAPALYAVGERATVAFKHVRVSGADFLDRLRMDFSRSFVRRVLHSGVDDFRASTGAEPDPAWMECPTLDNETLWSVRRDLEGRTPNEPAKERKPPTETLVGLTILQLQARGAVADGPYWMLDGRRVRVLRAANKLLHRVEAEYARDTPTVTAPDLVIAVGADSHALPFDIVRAGFTATIARGDSTRWLSRLDALQELGI